MGAKDTRLLGKQAIAASIVRVPYDKVCPVPRVAVPGGRRCPAVLRTGPWSTFHGCSHRRISKEHSTASRKQPLVNKEREGAFSRNCDERGGGGSRMVAFAAPQALPHLTPTGPVRRARPPRALSCCSWHARVLGARRGRRAERGGLLCHLSSSTAARGAHGPSGAARVHCQRYRAAQARGRSAGGGAGVQSSGPAPTGRGTSCVHQLFVEVLRRMHEP